MHHITGQILNQTFYNHILMYVIRKVKLQHISFSMTTSKYLNYLSVSVNVWSVILPPAPTWFRLLELVNEFIRELACNRNTSFPYIHLLSIIYGFCFFSYFNYFHAPSLIPFSTVLLAKCRKKKFLRCFAKEINIIYLVLHIVLYIVIVVSCSKQYIIPLQV